MVLTLLPSSRAAFKVRLCPVDVALAAVAPLAALYLLNVEIGSSTSRLAAGSYLLVSLVSSLIAFQIFHISERVPRYLSIGDVLDLAKVAVGSQLITAIVLFICTCLDGIPRSVPVIQALLLGTGLPAYRVLENLCDRRRCRSDRPRSASCQNVILIGLSDWSAIVLKFLKMHAPRQWRVIAVLDEEKRWLGRSVHGVQIFGPPAQLEAAIGEFAAHGMYTDRVAVSRDASGLSEEALAEVRRVCARCNVDLVFVPDLLALGSVKVASRAAKKVLDSSPKRWTLDFAPSPYLRFKRPIEFGIAAILLIWLLPLLAVAALVVVIDVGSPVLFWQQRVGRDGCELRVYKLRTLRPPFERECRNIPDDQRLSSIGRLLRRIRVDELPQLVNVLVGDMSLIGPRPLLPQDQPPNSAVRLSVRPGITGWAQVNGGTTLSPTEKEALDIWYVRNASPWLDLRIIWMTLCSLARVDHRPEKVLSQEQILGQDAGALMEFHRGGITEAVSRRPVDHDDQVRLPLLPADVRSEALD